MVVSVSLLACLMVTGAAGLVGVCFVAETDFSELAEGAGAGVDCVCDWDCVAAGWGFCSGCLGANFDMNCWLRMMTMKVAAKTRSSRRKSFGSWFGFFISGKV